jgi:hypothetical protein
MLYAKSFNLGNTNVKKNQHENVNIEFIIVPNLNCVKEAMCYCVYYK